MKQLLLFISVMACTFAATAQTKKIEEKPFSFELGPAVAHPIRYLNMFSKADLGLDGAVTHPLVAGFAAGVRVNYLYFFGRKADPLFTGGGDHYSHINIYNALAELNYKFDYNIVVGIDLGLGVLSSNGESDPAFAKKIYAGYQWDHSEHPLIFAAFFEQTDYHKNAGLRATVKF